jgi:serpin B
MKKWTAGILSALMLFSLCACSVPSVPPSPSDDSVSGTLNRPLAAVSYPEAIAYDDYDAKREVREENPVTDDFYAALDAFSYETASAVLKDAEGNANYSPLSLYLALSLAGTGAEGETQAQILSLLGVSDTETLSAQCANLYRLLYSDNEITKLKIANSLWMQNGVSFLERFVQNAAQNFYAETFPADFSGKETGKAMGQWVSENTNGTLAPEFETDPEQILAIINTVYFYDQWNDAFDEEDTAEAVFHAPDGDVTALFMNRTNVGGGYFTGDGFTRSSLSLKGGGKMVFVLPDEGVSLSALLSSAESVRSLFEDGEEGYGQVVWQVPKFGFDSKYELADMLQALGVTNAFEAEAADFSGVTNEDAFLSNVTQGTHIAINEKGVEASAYTEIGMCGTGMPEGRAEMILDRPFLYGITAPDGTLLFAGVCSNPAA